MWTLVFFSLVAQPSDAGWAATVRDDADARGERVLKVLLTPLPGSGGARAAFEPSWGAPSQLEDPAPAAAQLTERLRQLIQAGPAGLVVLTLDTRLPIAPGRAAVQAALAAGLTPELRFAGPTRIAGQPMPEVLALLKEVPAVPPLTRAQVRGVLQAAAPQVRGCYVSQLEQNALEGRLAVELLLSADGKVQQARVYDSQLGAPEVEACIVEVVKGLQFPKLRGSPSFTVRLPFRFEKGADKPPPPPIRK